MIKKCIECGATFDAPNKQKLLCSKRCAVHRRHRLEAERTKAWAIKEPERKTGTLDKALRRAKRKGMTYAEMQREETLRLIRKGKL